MILFLLGRALGFGSHVIEGLVSRDHLRYGGITSYGLRKEKTMSSLDGYSRAVEISHLVFAGALIFGSTSLLTISPAFAVPKGPAGQACKSSGKATVNGTEEGTGKAMKCTADYCTYDECETSGPNVGKCFTKTSYSNVRDCKAAARTLGPNLRIPQGQLAPSTMQPSQSPVQRAPMALPGGIMRRGVEGEQPLKNEEKGK